MKTFFRGRQTWLEAGLQKEIIPTPREHVSSELHHTSFFSRKCGLHFLRGAIGLLALLTIAAGFWLSPTQYSLAKPKWDYNSTFDTTVKPGTSSPSKQAEVDIVEQGEGNYLFKPATLQISKGTKVVWKNLSDGKHTVTSRGKGPLRIKNITQQNQQVSFVFNSVGIFAYFCQNHPKTMQAIVIVTPPSAAIVSPTPPAPSVSQQEVDIVEQGEGNYLFKPASLTISKGTKVVWKNLSDGKHTITSHDKGPLSIKNITQQNQQVSFVFNSVGTFAYFCQNHPKTMQAVIIVTDNSSTLTPS